MASNVSSSTPAYTFMVSYLRKGPASTYVTKFARNISSYIENITKAKHEHVKYI
jgi:hypothetical protein